MTTALTTGYAFPIPPLATGGMADGYGTLLQEADDHIKGDVNTLSGIVTTLSGSLTTTSGYLTTLSGSLTTLSGTVTTLSGTVTTLSGSLTTTSGYLTTLSGGVSTLSNYITTGWTDYSATSNIVGWSSFTVKSIKYKKIGTFVIVNFSISGTSNSTGLYFSLPYANAGPLSGTASGQATDNNIVLTAPAWITIGAGGFNVIVYKDFSGGDWTNSNTKSVMGQLTYEVAL